MYSRTRDITNDLGACLRVTVASHPSGALVTLERRDQQHRPSISLNLYGAELLLGFIMSARLAGPDMLPDEATDTPFSSRFHLDYQPTARVVVEQDESFPLVIDAPLWDRLYAELCLVTAHGRELARRAEMSLH
ncbi:MAG: hypothetical protein R3E11_03325 [Sphingobium sp.]|nr:hypothetical protein [Sphingobium sp.]MCP5398525.1 hypothetical protein [Sphingomonas sp.]